MTTAQIPTLFVCHGDDGGPSFHPCRRVQEALRAAGIGYDKVIAAHGSPIPFLRKGSRDDLRKATGTTKLPTLKLPRQDGHLALPRDSLLDRSAAVILRTSVPIIDLKLYDERVTEKAVRRSSRP